MIEKKSLITICLFTILSCLIIHFSVSLLSHKLPDSSSYLNFSPKYKSLYPFLINLVDTFNINLFFFQILVLSLSLIFLCYVVSKKMVF